MRLDWQHGGLAPNSDMSRAPQEIEEILTDHPWVSTESCTFGHKQHINILETRMIYRELVDVVHSCSKPLRCVLLVDSRAAAGAWAKGRSSSRNLNRLLRRCLGWTVAGQKSLHVVWVRSEANPADHPSRGRPIPAPPDHACEITHEVLGDRFESIRKTKSSKEIWQSVRSECQHMQSDAIKTFDSMPLDSEPCDPEPCHPAAKAWCFREIFAGSGHLTRAFKKDSRIRVLETVEIMHKGKPLSHHDILNDETFERLCNDAARPRQIWHFGFPCGSFSQLQHLNLGTRSKDNPEGNNSLDREIKGNEIFRRTMYLCELLAEAPFSLWKTRRPLMHGRCKSS